MEPAAFRMISTTLSGSAGGEGDEDSDEGDDGEAGDAASDDEEAIVEATCGCLSCRGPVF